MGSALLAKSKPTARTRGAVLLNLAPLQTAFRRYDPAHSTLPKGKGSSGRPAAAAGTVSVLEFERALLAVGVDITEEELAEVVTDLRIEQDGRVKYAGSNST